jgi:hypothetical protein
MNEDDVRKHAEEHGQAIVAGDLRRAGEDLTEEARGQAGPVMGTLPRPVTAASVESVRPDGGEFVARIRYSGEGSEAIVESRWAERDGRPMVVELTAV